MSSRVFVHNESVEQYEGRGTQKKEHKDTQHCVYLYKMLVKTESECALNEERTSASIRGKKRSTALVKTLLSVCLVIFARKRMNVIETNEEIMTINIIGN